MPGLLPTEDYARALIAVGHPGATGQEAGRLVQLRMARQQVLTRPDPPRLWMVLDEAVLRRHAGGPQVMRGQLGWLIEAAGLPHITLQVLPFSAGAHRGHPARDDPLGYLVHVAGGGDTCADADDLPYPASPTRNLTARCRKARFCRAMARTSGTTRRICLAASRSTE